MERSAVSPPADESHTHLNKRFRLFILLLILTVLLTVLWLYLHPAWQTHVNNYFAVGNGSSENVTSTPLKTSVTADSLMPVVWSNLRNMVSSEVQNRYTTTSTNTQNYYLTGDYLRSVVADAGMTLNTNSDGSVATLAVGAGDGITVGSDVVSVALDSNGGLLFNNGQVSLSTLCGDGELLKWNATSDAWECAVDIDTGSGTPLTVAGSDGSMSVVPVTAMEFGPATSSSDEFIVTDQGGGVARVRAGTAIPLSNIAQTISGSWTFSSQIIASGGVSCLDCITLGAETAGNYLASLIAGNGISITSLGGEGATPTVSVLPRTNGGLAFDTGQLSLLTSCSDGQLLKWATGSASWGCATDIDTDTTGTPLTVQETDNSPSVTSVATLQFGPVATSSDEFVVSNQTGGVVRVRTGAMVPLSNTIQTISGAWTFSSQIVASGGLSCTDCIALQSETTGSYIASLTTGNGITITAAGGEADTPTISARLRVNGGLAFDTGQLALLASCGDGQLLKWTAGSSSWGCAADIDTDTTGTPLTVQETDGSPLVTPVTALQFGPVATSSDEFVVTDQTGGTVRVRTGTAVPLSNTTQTISGAWTFSSQIVANGGLSCTDCIALTSETTGSYLASVVAGNGISISAAGGEADSPTLSVNLASGSGLGFTSGALGLQSCSNGQILKYNAGSWACGSDNADQLAHSYQQQLAGTDNVSITSSLTPLLTNGSGTGQSLGLTISSGNKTSFIATVQVTSSLATGPVNFVVIRDDNHDNDCVTGGGDGTQVGGQITSFVATVAQSFTTTLSFVDTSPASTTNYYQLCASTSIALGTTSATNRSLLLGELNF